MLTVETVRDPVTGRSFKSIGQRGIHTAHNYFTDMTWKSDSRHICVRTIVPGKEKSDAYWLVNTVSGTSRVILNEPFGSTVISGDDILYFCVDHKRQIRSIDLNSGVNRLVCELDEGCTAGSVSVTHDGALLGVNLNVRGVIKVGLIQASTGELTEVITPEFPEPYPLMSHAMINPVYGHLLFYCHEGKTEHVPDRLWVVNANTGAARNVYRQKRLEDGTHVEYVGHEMWDFNGNGLFFVKYVRSPLKPTGICYVDKLGERSEFINGDHPYWHVAVSPNGRYCVADTKKEATSKIVLIDLQTKASEVLCEVDCWGKHPGHPHPSFSRDSRKISFTYADDCNELRVGVVELGK